MLPVLAVASCLALGAALDMRNVVYTDGTGAMICYSLPTSDVADDEPVRFHTFRIAVVADGKFRLAVDLPGKMARDGERYSGTVIIPAEFVESAEILLVGSIGNSSRGETKKLKVRDFKQVTREKCWTEQK